jgi:lysophospholipase L1-like esterase
MGRKHYKQVIGNTKKLQCIALGGRAPLNINGGAGDSNRTTTEAQKLFTAGGRGGAIGGVRPMLSNWRLDSSGILEGENSMRIAASMLIPVAGNARIYTFAGQIFGMVGKGANLIADAGFDLDVTAGEQFLMRTAAQVSTSGFTMVGGNIAASSSDVSQSHTVSIIPATEADNCSGRVHVNTTFTGYAPTTGATAIWPFTPSIALGFSERPQPAILVIGDSNAQGTGDTTTGVGALGYVERGLLTTASGVTACSLWVRSGMTLGIYTVGNAARLFEAAEYHTHFIQQVSGNSISGGASLATMKQLTVLAWKCAKIRNLKVIQISSLPRTTSSANTTVATGWEVGGLRDQYNTWAQSVVGQKIDANGDIVSNGTVYLDAYWNVLDLLQDPVTNLWLSGTYTTDGIHMSATAHALAATRIATLADALTVY